MPGARAAAAIALLAALAACTPATAPTPQPPADQLDASVAQFRFDEGTRRLRAGITNDSDREVRVTQASIRWAAMAFPTVDLPGEAVPPGQTAAFRIRYGEARCTGTPSGRPVLTAVVNGRSRTLPLRVEDPGLLLRLHTKACAEQQLDATATVDLVLASRSEMVAGEEYVPGEVVVRRRPTGGAQQRVRLVDLGGSVLIDLRPRGGRRALPGELATGDPDLAFSVLLGSAHRCDPHALGQSSQTFLLSAYLRLGDRSAQRVVLPLAPKDRSRLTRVVRRDCG